jgi:hypothetical protein
LFTSAKTINEDCALRLPGDVPAIEITVTNSEPFNIVGLEDASFEEGTTGSAAALGCLISNSTVEALDGTHSLRMVATPAGATAGAMSITLGPYQVVPEKVYSVTSNVRGSAARTITVEAKWLDTDGGPLGSAGTMTYVDSDTAWQSPSPFFDTSVAPNDAASMEIVVTVDSPDAPVPPPTGLAVTAEGATGATLYAYVVTSIDSIGESLPSGRATITNGNAGPLTSSNYNLVGWTAAAGATGYKIYRGTPGDCHDLLTEFGTCADLWATLATCADLLTYIGVFKFVTETSGTSFNDDVNVLGPSSPPGMDTTGESAWVDENGAFPSAGVTVWNAAPPGAVMLRRSDGEFVQGASPLFPMVLEGGVEGSIIDYTAPYGQEVTYVALLAAFGSSVEPPSAPSIPVMMGQAPDTCTLYERLGWAHDEDSTGVLEEWLSGIGEMMQALDSVALPAYDRNGVVQPGWSQVLDVERCPTKALPWLGQFAGARFPTTWRDDQMRYAIVNSPGWARGTVAAILAAADLFLSPGYAASISERDPDPYSLTVTVPDAGVVGTATCESLFFTYATCADVLADVATCADLWEGVAEVTDSINAAIPAGLIVTISFI